MVERGLFFAVLFIQVVFGAWSYLLSVEVRENAKAVVENSREISRTRDLLLIFNQGALERSKKLDELLERVPADVSSR